MPKMSDQFAPGNGPLGTTKVVNRTQGLKKSELGSSQDLANTSRSEVAGGDLKAGDDSPSGSMS